jgi:hypothetical protein
MGARLLDSAPYADRVFLDGAVLTASGEVEEALAVQGGRITAVGSAEEIRTWIGPETEVVKLEGRALLPGFIDAHTHLVSQGLKETGYVLDLSRASSPEDALELVREAARARGADEWVLGRGWDESRWPNQRYLTREDLDRVAPENPVALSRVDGHLLAANSQALRRIPIEAPPEEFDPERGLLRERAVAQFLAQVRPSPDEIERAILAAVRLAHSLGVTSVHDVVTPEGVRAYQRLHRHGELALRVRLQTVVEHLDELVALGLATGFGDEMLRLGAIKVFADGSIGARNAALLEPYADEPSTAGKLNYPQDELNALTKRAHENGFQLMVHAIGDRAIEAALTALERAGVGPGDRARIEHFELPQEHHLERARELGVIASMQPNFLQWSGPEGLYETRLGRERDARIDPHRTVLEWGIPLAFGSDGMPFGPLYGLHWAVNAPHASQCLTVEEALHAYTLGAAYAGFDENALGSLEPGKLADLIVLSEDPGEARGRLRELRVEETYLGGERVYRASEA